MSEKKLVVWYVHEVFDDRSLQIDKSRNPDCDDKRKFVRLHDLNVAKRLGAKQELEKVIKLARKMPNGDDRLGKFFAEANLPMIALLDGGTIHKLTFIEEIEKRLKELD